MKRKFSWFLMFVGLAVIAAGLFLILNYTDPSTAGPFGILLTFLCLLLFSFAVIFCAISVGERLYFHFRPINEKDIVDNKPKIFRKRTIYVSVVLAFVPVFLISLNSIGQLQLRDLFLIALIEALAIFYIFKKI